MICQGISNNKINLLFTFNQVFLFLSPAVKNKMSKREFIRNTRNALPNLNSDFTGHLYDNIYLNGNIASSRLDDEFLTTVR